MSIASPQRRTWWVAFVTATIAGVLALFSAPALAQDAHVLRTDLDRPAPVAAGGTGTVTYTISNVGTRPTSGVLLTIALPPHVGLDPDGHCRRTGRTEEGGTLIRCDFSDAAGRFAPGESRVARTRFHIDDSAPPSATLGRMGVLVVPLDGGEAAESSADLIGPDTTWTTIRTAPRSAHQTRPLSHRAPAEDGAEPAAATPDQ